jgi:hypothetical protein
LPDGPSHTRRPTRVRIPNGIDPVEPPRGRPVSEGVEDTTGRTMVNLSATKNDQALFPLRRIRARSVVAARPSAKSVIVEGSGITAGTPLKS